MRLAWVVAGGVAVALSVAGAVVVLDAAGDGAADPARLETNDRTTGASTGARADAAPLIVHPSTAGHAAPSTAMRLVTPPPTTPPPTPPPTMKPPATTAEGAAPPPVTTGAPPGLLDIEVAELDLGAERASATIAVANAGGRDIVWSTMSDHPLVQVAPGGRLAPGERVEVPVTVARAGLVEGDYYAYVSVLGGGQGWPITVRWRVERPPVVHVLTPALAGSGDPCPDTPSGTGSTPATVPTTGQATVTVTVVDESAVAAVELTWLGPGPAGSVALEPAGEGRWGGTAGPLEGPGIWTLTVAATDGRGNTASATALVSTGITGAVVTKDCPTGR